MSETQDGASAVPDEAPEREVVALTEPAEGVPDVIDDPAQIPAVAERLAAGTGPIAADAERASGFKYGQDTYLVQLRRAGVGTLLIDSAACPDLSALADAAGDAEWVLHAASQDLPGFRELGMVPARVFDTELAARLLGWPKVGLAAVVEHVLGLRLAKEHSAQDWSTRPLPHAWLVYAALDVEVLVEVRDFQWAELVAAGKDQWALQEFEAVRTAEPPAPKPDPWRRTSGAHALKDRRQLAVVRALWRARDAEARRRDVTPGRVIRDQAIVAAAQALPRTLDALYEVREWQSRGTRRRAKDYYPAIAEALALPAEELPPRRGPRTDAPPPPRAWSDRNPEADARLKAVRPVITALSEEVSTPAENLLQPDALRRSAWEFPDAEPPADVEAWVRAFLAGRGARPWQIDLTAPLIARAFETAEVDAAGPQEDGEGGTDAS